MPLPLISIANNASSGDTHAVFSANPLLSSSKYTPSLTDRVSNPSPSTKLTDGSTAGSGFQALSQYDSNGDGIIDESDELYSKLLIWHDKNSDGVSQDSELISLKNAGIKTISLNIDNTAGRNISVVTYEDGTTTKLGEFDFDAQYYNTIEKTDIEVSDEIKELPDVKAIGNVESLHTSMQKDESGILKKYVEQFKLSDSRIEKEAIVTNILYFITGAKDVASNSRGNIISSCIFGRKDSSRE